MNYAIYAITRKIGRALVLLDLSDRLMDLLSRSLSIRLISRWGALLNVVCFYLHSTPSGVGSRDLEIAPTKGWCA